MLRLLASVAVNKGITPIAYKEGKSEQSLLNWQDGSLVPPADPTFVYSGSRIPQRSGAAPAHIDHQSR